MKKISFRIPEKDLQEIDNLIKKYPNIKDRSDFLRKAAIHAIKYHIGVSILEE